MNRYVIFQNIILYHLLSIAIKLRGRDLKLVVQSDKVIICRTVETVSTDIHKEFDALDGGYCPQDGAPRVVGWYAKYELGPPPIPMTAHGKDLVYHVLGNEGAEGRIKLFIHFGFAGLVK
jgi:hypothetical protein